MLYKSIVQLASLTYKSTSIINKQNSKAGFDNSYNNTILYIDVIIIKLVYLESLLNYIIMFIF